MYRSIIVIPLTLNTIPDSLEVENGFFKIGLKSVYISILVNILNYLFPYQGNSVTFVLFCLVCLNRAQQTWRLKKKKKKKKNINEFSHNSGAGMSKIAVHTGLVSDVFSFPVLQIAAFSLCPHMAFLHPWTLFLFLFLYGHQSYWNRASLFFNLHYLFKNLSPNQYPWQLRFQRTNLGWYNSVHSNLIQIWFPTSILTPLQSIYNLGDRWFS